MHIYNEYINAYGYKFMNTLIHHIEDKNTHAP